MPSPLVVAVHRLEYNMIRPFLLVAWLLVIFGFVNEANSAKRLGAGKDVGTQRSAAATNTTKPVAAAPAPAPVAAPVAKPSPWLGPMAGLAAGLGLGMLLGHMGLGGEVAAMIMALLIGLMISGAVFFVIVLMKSKKETPPPEPLVEKAIT